MIVIGVTIFLVVFAAIASVSSENDSAIVSSVQTEDNESPLAVDSPSTPPSTNQLGAWKKVTNDNGPTGDLWTGFNLESTWSTWDDGRGPGTLLHCHPINGLELAFSWPQRPSLEQMFGDEVIAPVEYTVDGVKRTSWWTESFTNVAWYDPKEDLHVLLGLLSSAEEVELRYWYDDTKRARYRVRGISTALEQLKCSIPRATAAVSEAKQSLARVEAGDGAGSGIVVGRYANRSLVVTAWHVIAPHCQEVGSQCDGVFVVTAEGRYEGNLRAFDAGQDLALLYVKGTLPPAKLAVNPPAIGTAVVSIGFPGGVHDFQHNEGFIVPVRACSFEACITTDARAWSGFSGGALINFEGEVVGVISEGWQGTRFVNAVSVAAIRALLGEE